jgi:predicted PolB exonuclease-like 3'-5' exonuclease
MADHVIVWDLETVPDLDAVARAHHLPELDVEVRETLGEKFPKLPFHQIVCIGAVVAEKVDGVWWVTAIGAPHIGERSEKELIATFVEKIAAIKPRLVTFNGASFDLPVLRYRAMLHRISAPGLEGRPYFKRYTDDATDLCDVLSSFDSRSKMKLDDLCRALNLPGKPDGIDGSQVEQLFAEGRILEVADYCECDVVSTYRLWLLHELFKGTISAEEHERSELALSDFIAARIQDKPHWARLRAGAAVEAVVKMTVLG